MTHRNPWHLRLPNTQHYRWFQNLVEIHQLTTAWIEEIRVGRPTYLQDRGVQPKLSQNLWMLESLSSSSLDQLLTDATPDELLIQLDQTVWAVQAWTLTHILSETPEDKKLPLQSLLEQVSWKTGKACAEKRWKDLPRVGALDLGSIYLALQDTPFSGYPEKTGYFLKRLTRTEVSLELNHCPHRLSYSEIQPIEDTLCALHAQWTRGFTHFLNQGTTLDHQVTSPRCIQKWYFGNSHEK